MNEIKVGDWVQSTQVPLGAKELISGRVKFLGPDEIVLEQDTVLGYALSQGEMAAWYYEAALWKRIDPPALTLDPAPQLWRFVSSCPESPVDIRVTPELAYSLGQQMLAAVERERPDLYKLEPLRGKGQPLTIKPLPR
jgi:hypothetical protein